MQQKKWKRGEIISLLRESNRAVEKGIVRIYDLQTQDEKVSDRTNHNNGIGFAACDAKKGSYYARWVLKGRSLTDYHLDNARLLCVKYSRQLTAIANGKLG